MRKILVLPDPEVTRSTNKDKNRARNIARLARYNPSDADSEYRQSPQGKVCGTESFFVIRRP